MRKKKKKKSRKIYAEKKVLNQLTDKNVSAEYFRNAEISFFVFVFFIHKMILLLIGQVMIYIFVEKIK